MAWLHGLCSPPLEGCRVLELGCGDAAHLLWVAATLPGSQCVGIDRAGIGLRQAQALAQQAGLTNITLLETDLRDLGPDLGQFDYVLAHGLYSWVPATVRDQLLVLCARHLTSNGVALVSYNLRPGWQVRNRVGSLLRLRTHESLDPRTKVAEARRWLEVLAGWATQGLVEAEAFAQEIDRLRALPDHVLYHDDLTEEVYAPTLTGFLREAATHGLQYLAEAHPSEARQRTLPEEVRRQVTESETDRARREDTFDHLQERAFRRTLLCHAGLRVHPEPALSAVAPMAAAGSFAPCGNPGRAGTATGKSTDVFQATEGLQVRLPDARHQVMVRRLGEAWPAAVPYAALRGALEESPAGLLEESEFNHFLLEGLNQGLLSLFLTPPELAVVPGSRPRAHPLARAQATVGREVTALHGSTVSIPDPFTRLLVRLLDGTRDRRALAAELASAVVRGEVAAPGTGIPGGRMPTVGELERGFRQALEGNLERLGRLGLLAPD